MIKDENGFNILIIEDNPGDLALVEDFLFEQIECPKISLAKNFREARETLTDCNKKFNIILLDLSLPDKTGESLIREIVELSQNIPIIVLTGYSDFSFGIRSLSLGASDYILKDELTSISLYKSIIHSCERKKNIFELEQSEQKYSELFNLSPLPMYVFELGSLRFLDVNDAFIKSYGYSREELLLMDIRKIRPPEEIPALEISLLNDNPDKKNNCLGILKHRKKNGDIIYVDIKSNFIQYKGKCAKITIANDITERLNYIKAIEEQNEKLREISWIQSHVVRAPLSRIMGLIPLINEKSESDHEKEKMLEYVLVSANELDDIIKNITDKTRVADYQINCSLSPVCQ
jgi:PAS domain S-box-containing protein